MHEYLYPHFRRTLILEDMAFRAGPKPGESMPDFDLPTIDGGRITKSDFVGQRPLVLTFGSVTCPMTAAARDVLKELYEQYGDRVAFVTLYVREAHPGDRYPQASSMEDKIYHARAYAERDQIPWPIAVDDTEGTLHRALDPKPNAAYVMAEDGTVAFRTLWSNDAHAMRDGLRRVLEGDAAFGQKQTRLIPMISGMGSMYQVLERSGPTAKRDVLRQAPPMYAMARIADLYRPLPPLARGLAAMATVGVAMLGLSWGMRRLLQR